MVRRVFYTYLPAKTSNKKPKKQKSGMCFGLRHRPVFCSWVPLAAQDLFNLVLTLKYLEELFGTLPETINSLHCYVPGEARWISKEEKGRETFSRRDSHDLPIAKVVSERWITFVRRSTDSGRWRKRVAGFIHRTFSSSKYYRDVPFRYMILYLHPVSDDRRPPDPGIEEWERIFDVYQPTSQSTRLT